MNQRNRPQPNDVVLGGENLPQTAAVLGGIEGVKNRLASDNVAVRIAATREANHYGEAGWSLLLSALKDLHPEVYKAAYLLLEDRPEPEVKRELLRFNPYEMLECIQTIEGHSGLVLGVAIHPNGKLFATSGSADKSIKLWNLDCGDCLRSWRGHKDWVNGVAFRPDGGYLGSCSRDFTVKLWDVEKGDRLPLVRHTLIGHTGVVHQIAFTPNGRSIISASADCTIKVWQIVPVKEGEVATLKCILTGHTSQVEGVAMSCDGKTVASASWDRTIKIWDIIDTPYG
ncbi:WD40 repeat domain-containing protein [Phormidium sp. CCY1219]|uniref:WD40 repeat domain-containing protein n=1 Tax=Phormidium sp. CCY1219 TaxID=2886104 RepID=UPI002D1F7ABF|nr:WD40 repeat domain-containing protein [Phormidium sp. CCY1219]MEB3827656.1 WD40 repeat domain-containing protein [Phormidium sp. CCY1219]